MDKIRSHLEGDSERLLAFKRQWLRMHRNAYKGPLISASSRRLGSSKPNKPNKKHHFSDDRPSANLNKYGPAPDSKKNRPLTSSVYCSICKTAGKPENVWSSHHTRDCPNNPNPSGKDLERRLRVVRAATPQTIATTLVAVLTAIWGDISRMITEWTKTILEIDIAPHRSTMTNVVTMLIYMTLRTPLRATLLKGKMIPTAMVLGRGTGSEVLHVEHAEPPRRRSLSF
jgi:hypothetical protein